MKNSINEQCYYLTDGLITESFLIKSIIGNSNEGGNVKGIFSKLHDDIFSIGVNKIVY